MNALRLEVKDEFIKKSPRVNENVCLAKTSDEEYLWKPVQYIRMMYSLFAKFPGISLDYRNFIYLNIYDNLVELND